MRQQHDQARLPNPLGLAAGYELVNDTLGRVREVTELGLPDHQSVGVGHRVAQLKAEDSILAERAVTDGVGRLVGVEVRQLVVGGHVDLLMVQHVVALREGASLHVLTCLKLGIMVMLAVKRKERVTVSMKSTCCIIISV